MTLMQKFLGAAATLALTAGAALAEDLIVPDANGGVWIYDPEYRFLRYCRVGDNGAISCVTNRD